MAVQQQLDKLTDLVRDHIIGMSVIRAFNRSAMRKPLKFRCFPICRQKKRSWPGLMPSAAYDSHHLQHEHRRHPLDRRLSDRLRRTADRRYYGHHRICHPHSDESHHGRFRPPRRARGLICYGGFRNYCAMPKLPLPVKIRCPRPLAKAPNTQAHHNSACSDSHGHAPLLEFRHVTFRYDGRRRKRR